MTIFKRYSGTSSKQQRSTRKGASIALEESSEDEISSDEEMEEYEATKRKQGRAIGQER